MGIYLYKVTAEKVKLNDGTFANVAKFAYKPVYMGWDADKMNSQMHKASGSYVADRYVKGKNYTGRVVFSKEAGTKAVLCKNGTFEDCWYDKAQALGYVA